MATNTEFYCDFATGADINAGDDKTVVTSTNGDWGNAAANRFTAAAGTPFSGVVAGDFASVYLDGATTAVYIARVTAVNAGGASLDLSATAKSGTAPTTGATGRSCTVGGKWKGPAGASMFPLAFIQNTMTDSSARVPRVTFFNGADYAVTAGTTISGAGPVVWEGARVLLTSVAAEADDDIFTKVGHGFVTGDPMVLMSGTGFTGVTVDREYYVIRLDNDTFRIATSKNRAFAGTYVDVTVDGTSGVVRAPALAKITGDSGTAPFVLLIVSGTRHVFNYLEFSTNGFDSGPVGGGDIMVSTTSGGTSLRFYRCRFSDSYRAGIICGGAGGILYECEASGCNLNANNNSGSFEATAATTYIRCVAHHGGKTADNGDSGFVMNAGTGLRLTYIGCIAAESTGTGWLNHTGNCLASLHGCIAYNNISSGMQFVGNTGSVIFIENCIFVNNNLGAEGSSAGIRFLNAGFGAMGFGNAFYNNGANGNFTNGIPALFQDTKDLSANPFTDGDDGDFSLNDTSGGGAELKDTGAGNFFNAGVSATNGSYSETTSTYPDIGAVQHESTGGSPAASTSIIGG